MLHSLLLLYEVGSHAYRISLQGSCLSRCCVAVGLFSTRGVNWCKLSPFSASRAMNV